MQRILSLFYNFTHLSQSLGSFDFPSCSSRHRPPATWTKKETIMNWKLTKQIIQFIIIGYSFVNCSLTIQQNLFILWHVDHTKSISNRFFAWLLDYWLWSALKSWKFKFGKSFLQYNFLHNAKSSRSRAILAWNKNRFAQWLISVGDY